MENEEQSSRGGKVGMWRRMSAGAMPLFDRLTDIAYDDARIIRREVQLFLGIAFASVGLFHFRSGKYCDGNTADYLSCTRPAAYYYYGSLEIVLLILGVFLIALWFLKRREMRN